jgi:hypothetical protein
MILISPMTLDNFALSCGVTELSKTIYPYEKWLCPKEIADCKKFPPYEDFKSSLSKLQSQDVLSELENIATNRLSNGEWTSQM